MAQEFSLGQQVIVVANGEEVRGTITRHERGDNDEYVYYISSEDSAERGPFRLEEIRAG